MSNKSLRKELRNLPFINSKFSAHPEKSSLKRKVEVFKGKNKIQPSKLT